MATRLKTMQDIGSIGLERTIGRTRVRTHPLAHDELRRPGGLRRLALSQWLRISTALIAATSIWIGGFAGYANWPWWAGPAIGSTAGILNSLPTLTDLFEHMSERLTGFVLNVVAFGAMPYAMYALVHALAN